MEQIVASVLQRRRRLSAWSGCSVGLVISGAVTFTYLLLAAFGLVPDLPWTLYFLVNVLAGLGGWLYGRGRPIGVLESLYRLDRALGLGEKLTTLHELKESEQRPEFRLMLEARVERLPRIEPARVFAMARRDQRRWIAAGSLYAAGILVVLLLDPQSPLRLPSVSPPAQNPAQSEKSPLEFTEPSASGLPSWPSTTKLPSQTIEAQAEQLRQRLENALKNSQGKADPQVQRELAQIARELEEMKNALWGETAAGANATDRSRPGEPGQEGAPSPPTASGAKPPTNNNSGDPEDRPGRRSSAVDQKRQETEQLKRDLEQLQDQLENEELSLQELREWLRTRGGPSDDPELNQALEDLSQATDAEAAAQALARVIDLLRQKQAADRKLQESESRLRTAWGEGEGQDPSRDPGAGSTDLSMPSGPGQGSGNGRGPGEEGPDQPELRGGGDTAGRNPGGHPLGVESLFPEIPPDSPNLMAIPGRDMPDAEVLMTLFTQGVPLNNLRPTSGAAPRLQVDYAKVSAALDLLGVPPELRDEILWYFISLSHGVEASK
jgi:hypothetical protein